MLDMMSTASGPNVVLISQSNQKLWHLEPW